MHNVEPLECFGVVGGKAFSDAGDQIHSVKVAVLFDALIGKRVYIAAVKARIRFLIGINVVCVMIEFFALAAFGVIALFVEHAPIPDFGDVGGKGNLSARVKIRDRLAEKHEGVTRQVGLAFFGATALQAEVGVNQIRLLCHERNKEVPEMDPKGVNCPLVGFCARGVLGSCDEVVDFGVGGLDVELHELLLWWGEKKEPFDLKLFLNQKALFKSFMSYDLQEIFVTAKYIMCPLDYTIRHSGGAGKAPKNRMVKNSVTLMSLNIA